MHRRAAFDILARKYEDESGRIMMKSPKLVTWCVALIIGVLGILIKLGVIAIIGLPFALNPFWVVVAALVLLALATILPGL